MRKQRDSKSNHAIFPDQMRYYIQVEAAGKGKSNVWGRAVQLQIPNAARL
jgi:hypothetical protein